MSLRLPAAVLFDLDGTLLDSLPGIEFCVDAALRAEGLPPRAETLAPFIGPPVRQIMANALKISDDALLDRLEGHFRALYDTEGWQRTPCFPGADAILGRMRGQGTRLFVVSNKPRHISLRILEREGVLSLFEEIYTRDSKQPPYADKAQMIEALLREQNVSSSNCWMVGDTMEDAGAAAKQAVDFVFLEHGYGAVTGEFPVRLNLQSFAEFQPYLDPGEGE